MFALKDTPNDRVLNMVQGLEALLMKCLEKDSEHKEELTKYLGMIRKALEGQYDKLPAPSTAPKAQPVKAEDPLLQTPYYNYHVQAEQAAQQQQAIENLTQQLQGTMIDPFGFWRR